MLGDQFVYDLLSFPRRGGRIGALRLQWRGWGVSSLSSTSHAVGATWRGLAVGEIIEYSRVPTFVLDVKLRAGEFEVLLLKVISCSSTQPANLA